MKSVKISNKAYTELTRRVDTQPELYKSRGIIGALDDVLFGEFTTKGRGGLRKVKNQA